MAFHRANWVRCERSEEHCQKERLIFEHTLKTKLIIHNTYISVLQFARVLLFNQLGLIYNQP